MTTHTFTKLAHALDYDDWRWLQDEYPRIADAVEAEVLAGAEPDDIRRFVTAHIGEHRQGTIARCVGAARWLKGQQ